MNQNDLKPRSDERPRQERADERPAYEAPRIVKKRSVSRVTLGSGTVNPPAGGGGFTGGG